MIGYCALIYTVYINSLFLILFVSFHTPNNDRVRQPAVMRTISQ